MAIGRDEFRAALGRFASGVTVVTTCSGEDVPYGLTVSAFSSLSLDPPLVLVCIDQRCGSHKALIESGIFAINLLAHDQEAISRRFSSKIPDKFVGVAHQKGIRGVPLLEGTLATLECRLVRAYEGGDHTIFIGEIEKATVRNSKPLLYYQGNYAQLSA